MIISTMKSLNCPLIKVPDIGYIQAAYKISATINISRFDIASKTLAFTVLDPKIRQCVQFNTKAPYV